jgi:fimbrial chaperone protein
MRVPNVLLKLSLKFFEVLLLVGFVFPLSVHAGISVSPLSATLNLDKARSHLLIVTNTNPNQAVAVRVRAVHWQLDEKGRDVRSPTDALVLFPFQFILPAGGRRSIRVSPRISLSPEVEQSYRVLVQQVPVDLTGNNEAHSGIRLMTSYATAFYIAPSKPFSQLEIESSTKEENKLSFTLVNKGNAHTHLHRLSITVIQDGREYLIEDPEVLKGIYNENLLANSQRDFTLNWPKSLKKTLDFKTPMTLQLKISCESCGGKTVYIETPIL